ncbi:MAG: hypothetical protein QOH06_6131 [Acidobacteriota bacterium]|jgi:hypothetical protein|nr:hypothetical protein [Acidobacteriota bacterium]
MADINYFLKPLSWKVLANGGALLGKILPLKGSMIKIERQAAGSPKIRIVALDGAASPRVLLKDFKFQKLKGRLELTPPKADYVLIIEEDKTNGQLRVKARAEPIQPTRAAGPVRKLPKEDMTGTWGAEANPGGGKG